MERALKGSDAMRVNKNRAGGLSPTVTKDPLNSYL